MFDIGASELLVIVIVAILVIGPKDMPRAMRTAGRWIGKMRRMSSHFRAGIDEMVRQSEMEDLEKKWADQNARIMAKYPAASESEGGAPEAEMKPLAEPADPQDPDAAAEAAIRRAAPKKASEHDHREESEPSPPPAAPPLAPPGKDKG